MSNNKPGLYEERESIGSKPSKGINKDVWIEEDFGNKTDNSAPKKHRSNSKSRIKKK